MFVFSTFASCCYRISLVLLSAAGYSTVRYCVGTCPEGYWDVPSKICSQPFYGVLEEIQHLGPAISEAVKMEKICRNWDSTASCYQHLLDQCIDDYEALRQIRSHINRYAVFTLPCREANHHRKQINTTDHSSLVDCFLPDIVAIQSCSYAYDTQFRISLEFETYISACRVISRTLRCFHDIKASLLTRCHRSAAALIYQESYIQPVVDETRRLVTTKCSLPSPYIDYFNSSAANRCTVLTMFLYCCYWTQLYINSTMLYSS